MDFYIKKFSTLPLIKMQVVNDGRSDFRSFMESLETSTITFSMTNLETGIPKIVGKPAYIVEKTQLDPNALPEYYIYYQFRSQDTLIKYLCVVKVNVGKFGSQCTTQKNIL